MRLFPIMRRTSTGLIVLGIVFGTLISACAGPRSQQQPTPIPSQAVSATVTLPAYPLPVTVVPQPTKTPVIYPTINPNETRPPKPTLAPTFAPTLTPNPTALPLPPSALYSLWVEIVPDPKSVPAADEPGSVLWRASPGDIGNRIALARFEHQQIREVSVSPSGRQIAFTSAPRRGLPNPLWVANVDGSNLKQLAPDASQLIWSQDGGSIVYGVSRKIEGADGSAMDMVDVASGVQTRLQTFEPDLAWHTVSWPATQQQVYFARAQAIHLSPRDLWLVEINTKTARKVIELADDINAGTVSPDGSKYFGNAPQGLVWHSIDQQSQKVLMQPGRRFSAIWSLNNRELITTEWGADSKQMAVRAIDVNTLLSRNLGAISPPADLRLLALSPDDNWLAFDQQNVGLLWVHLPTGLKVPVPSSNSPLRFAAWVNR